MWLAARSDGAAPRRSDINMRSLAPFLENMLLYQWDGIEHLRCRVMGGNVQDRVQFSPQDTNWIEHIASDLVPASKSWWTELYDRNGAGAMEYSITYTSGDCRMGLALFMPVRHKNEEIHVFSMQAASPVYRVSEQTEGFIIGEDLLRTVHIDISDESAVSMTGITEHKRVAGAPEAFRDVGSRFSAQKPTTPPFKSF